MRKLGKSRKIGISVAVACCMLLTIVFFADIKNLFVLAAEALSALISAEETVDTSTTIVMRTEDAYDVYETDGYYAFSVYAPSTATYTIGVTAENGSVRVNTGEAMSVNDTEMSVSLTEGTNVLYIMGCVSPSIQWERETCDLEPINKVCALVAGDLDQNGERTLEELIRLKKEAKAEGALTTDTLARTEIADIDGDDSITDEDARLLRELLVGNPRYEASELRPVIVDAYLADTGILYDSLADAIADASEISVSETKSVTVTVLNPSNVKMTAKVPVQNGAQIVLQDDGAQDNGWCRTITRDKANFKMFAIGDASLTLTGSSESDENSSLILDGGAIANSGNHIVDVGNNISAATATLTMNAGVKLTNNENNGSSSSGGAIAVKGIFNMNGGIISGNIATGTGGAITLLAGATMNMSGGTITGNETRADIYSGGGVNISNGATLIMTGGEIYGNIAPDSVDRNSVRKSGTDSVLQMGGSAYIDRVCFDTTSVDTHCMELTSKLTTDKKITLFFTQPLNTANPVVKRVSSYEENDSLFELSERMLPCQLVQDDSNENLCLRSDITEMDTVTATAMVYSGASDLSDLFETIDNTWAVQGVCSDDQYLYMAIAQSPSIGCKILRVDLGTWENPVLSATLPTDHSNEMTYNPDTGKIYIVHCISTGAGSNTTAENGPLAISVVDPSNLDVIEDVIFLPSETAYTGKTGIYALAYNATQKCYIAGGTGFGFGFFKDDNGTIKECAMPNTGLAGFTGYTAYTKQGVYATDTTIYTNTWYDITNVDDEEQNFITMYDWSGNYNGTKLVVNSNGTPFTQEVESMFEYNGEMYMACFPTNHIGVEIHKLGDVGTAVSTIDVKDEEGHTVDGVYTNLSDAITKANELGTATLVLKADVTVGETQTITGNVTITDDGTARTITRQAFTEQMFVVADGAGLIFTATGTDKTSPTLTIDGNGEVVGASGAMVSLGTGSGTLAVNHAVRFTNANINEDGGIIRTEAGSTAKVTINGGVFADNAAEVAGALNGGLIKVVGEAEATISNALFENNEISSTGGALKGGIVYIGNTSTVNVVGSTFTSNAAYTNSTGSGGVIGVYDSGTLHVGKYVNASDETIEGDCYFTDNTFSSYNGYRAYGGVFTVSGGSANVCNSIATGNTADYGGVVSVGGSYTLTVEDCTFEQNEAPTDPNTKDLRAAGTVIFKGKVKTNVYCTAANRLKVNSQLTEGSKIIVAGATDRFVEDATVVTFASEEIMADCQAKGYFVLKGVTYGLKYETTSDSKYIAKLVNVVAMVGEEEYASLASAIEAANALDSATIVLKADVTVGATQTITGNVTITDDGTPRKITREEGFTDQMFVVADDAGLTFTATGTDKTSPTLTIDGNNVGPSRAMVSLGDGSGTLNVNNAVMFTNANINEDGGIIRTEAGSTATVTIDGGIFADNTAEVEGALDGGLIKVVDEAVVTISDALFQENTISSTANAVKGVIIHISGGTVNVVGTTFTSNTANTKTTGSGGVIGVYDGGTLHVGKYDENGETIEGICSFTNNTFTGESYGGAISINGANANVYNTTIQNNKAKYGGGTHVAGSGVLTVGDSTITDNETTGGSARTNINVTTGTVRIEGEVKASIFCSDTERLHVKSKLSEGSEIKVAWLTTGITEGETVVTFENQEVMTDCQEKGYLVLVDNSYVLSQDYTLTYDTTDNTAKLARVVATIEEEKYASLEDAITAANALETTAETPATIVLKADVTVDETQTIEGNVTITDDGYARTITRGAECTAQIFDVQQDASLSFVGTGTLAEDSTVQGTIIVDGDKDNVTATASMITNAGTFTLGTNASLTNAGNADVAYGGALYNTGTVALAGTLSGNEGGRGGAIYNSSGTVTVSGGEYSGNTASVHGAVIMSVNGTVEITGGTFTDNTAVDRGGVILSNNAEVTISGGEFSENVANGTTGGGVFGGTSTAVLTITDGNFHDNQAIAGGGVIESNGTVTIKGGTFERNSAFEGGVFYMNTSGALTIEAGEFYSNTTTNATDAAGGVIYIAKNTLNITGGTFGAEEKGNVSYQRGGAIYIADRDAAPTETNISIKNATFSYNSAQHGTKASSGMMYVGKNSIVDIEACTIDHNEVIDTDTSAKGAYYWAGVMYVDSSVVNVIGTTFSYNKALTGGAIYVTGSTTQLTVNNSSFLNNEVTTVNTNYTDDYDGFGGAIYMTSAATVEITDGTFTDNSACRGGAIFVGGSSKLTLHDCQMDNTASQYGPDILTNGGSDIITLSGLVIAEIDKRAQVLVVKGSLTIGSSITIGQISGTATVFVQFDSLEDMNNSKDYIHFDVANNKFPNGTLYFDETTYQAIIQE